MMSSVEPRDLPAAPRRTRRRTFGQLLRRRMTAGLILVIPIWITFVVVEFLFHIMRDASLWAVEAMLVGPVGKPMLDWLGITAQQVAEGGSQVLPPAIRWGVAIFACLVTITLLYFLGMVTSHFLGRRAIAAAEAIVDRMPLVKTVYRASKQVLAAFAGDSGGEYQRVALIPFPSDSLRSIGFITRLIRDAKTGEEYCACFIAAAPNPTSGFVFVCRRSEITELDLSVEDAIRMVMSGGVLLPEVMNFSGRVKPVVLEPAAVRT